MTFILVFIPIARDMEDSVWLFILYKEYYTLSIFRSFYKSFDIDTIFKEYTILSKAQLHTLLVAYQMEQYFHLYFLQ